MSRREFTLGAWVHVAPHQGVGGQKTFRISGQFMGLAEGDSSQAVVGLVDRAYKNIGVFKNPPGGSPNDIEILVPKCCLSPKW